jgi:LmbE family N-acetylglucosaminyl deacetylase
MNDAVLFSPHLDDATLSASRRLIAGDIHVVTIFSGAPPPETGLRYFDRLTGATSSHARILERWVEDDEAMKILNCDTTRLGELDHDYRDAPVDSATLERLVEPFTRNATEVWVPAGILGHPDHIATREAVIATVPAEADLYIYADIPYSMRFGWPSWVCGQDEPQYIDVSFWLEHELESCGLDRKKLQPMVFELDNDLKRHKEQAALCYRTQLPVLKLSPADAPRWQEFLTYELAWKAVDA